MTDTASVCVRCCANEAKVRALCAECDLALAMMHWSAEHLLFDRVVYMTKVEAQWFRDNGYHRFLKKLPQPGTPQPNEAMLI